MPKGVLTKEQRDRSNEKNRSQDRKNHSFGELVVKETNFDIFDDSAEYLETRFRDVFDDMNPHESIMRNIR